MKRTIKVRQTEIIFSSENTPQNPPPQKPDRREWFKIIGGWFVSIFVAVINLLYNPKT